ncbi:hypothetical protein [Flagellimonas sp.]|uniref:hypothetical protein n=1 Tax=Flagellimonas sp. TaxID=2058762 RepID=UPI003F4A46E8
MKKTNKMELLLSILLGLLMVVFGLNKFLGFIPVEPPADETAQQFLGTMFTSYLFVVVGIAEIIAAPLLVFAKTRFIGWLILLPVIFNIVAFHIAHDFVGNGIWLLPTGIFIAIGYYKVDSIAKLLKL